MRDGDSFFAFAITAAAFTLLFWFSTPTYVDVTIPRENAPTIKVRVTEDSKIILIDEKGYEKALTIEEWCDMLNVKGKSDE